MSKTSTESKAKYNAKAYDLLSYRIPKELASAFKDKCASEGISQAQVIKQSIESFIKSEGEA